MLSQQDCVAAITAHSLAFADAVRDNLDAEVEYCPGWTVADLVSHLTDVHWTWATIVEEHRSEPVAPEDRPPRVDDDRLVATFEAGAARLVRVLAAADPQAPVWTWAPAHQDARFVVRHQVQEMVVHHWDAEHARGRSLAAEPALAADAVDEFLEMSVSTDTDPADPATPDLGGVLVLACTDTGDAWRITPGSGAGTTLATRVGAPAVDAAVAPVAGQQVTLAAPATDLLLWLYGRVALEVPDADRALVERFRTLTYTD